MKKQAFADRYPYGIFSCIRTMGHIYKSRGNFDLSAQYYQEALDYMLKNMPDQDPSQLYSSLAEYYRNTQKDYATALDYCEKALKSAKTERNIAQAMIEKCLVLFRQGRIDEFNDCYKEAVQMADRCKLSASVSLLIAHISKNILDKQYEQAHAHADQLSEEGLQQHAYIYECAKDYPNAIKYLKKYHQQLDSTNNLLQLSDIAELNTQIGAERLKMENIQATSRYRITLFSIVTGFLLLSLLFLMLYLHRKRKVNLELCHKNEELSEARDQAEAANKAKSIFLQNMSHEIRTPLNSIVGFSQLITSPDANLSQEERQDFCHLIQHNSDLLLTLVGDILSAAELESNRYTMKIAPHSCNKLCREAITTVEHRKPEGVKLYYTSEVDDCYELSTDGQRVCQILINFLTNAEKHTTQGEIRLHCSLTEHPGYVTFSVTDTGTGIPPEYSETIFERFEKADNFGQGTGLGLNICRLIAERLKGQVLLDKEYKEGARFVFVLPVEEKIRVILKLERIGQRRNDAIKIQFIDTPVSYRKVSLSPCINGEHIFPAISIDDGKAQTAVLPDTPRRRKVQLVESRSTITVPGRINIDQYMFRFILANGKRKIHPRCIGESGRQRPMSVHFPVYEQFQVMGTVVHRSVLLSSYTVTRTRESITNPSGHGSFIL